MTVLAEPVAPAATPPPAPQASNDPALRRLERREMHRSRSVATSLALLASTVVAGAIGAAAVLHRTGTLPLTPSSGLDARVEIAGLTVRDPQAVLGLGLSAWIWLVAAAVIAVLGIVWLVLAFAAGRRARHVARRQGHVLLVDDGVLASSLSLTAARAAGVRGDTVRTSLGRRRCDVDLTISPGEAPDLQAARAALDETLRSMALTEVPRVRTTTTVKERR